MSEELLNIILDLEANAINGKENFCYIGENKLNAIKELSKREFIESKQLKEQLENKEQSLIKYLEDKIKIAQKYMESQNCKPQGDWSIHYYYAERDEKIYQDILERIKSGKYE